MRNKTVRIDLTKYRCPDAISLFRRGVAEFLKSNCSELEVIAIEPSLTRDIPYVIKHNGWKLRLETSSTRLSKEHLNEMKVDPDDDTYDGVSELLFFKMARLH
ncbi:hypothetical protein [Vibrio sp. TRT 29B02]|uniref:hypothetical protein n=1 Tax=Vibrio sp. TRT 29B02 TaxID=3418508 RepID=UPI003CED652B